MEETDNSPNCVISQERFSLATVYRCQVAGCGARFRKAAHLRRHAAVHTEEASKKSRFIEKDEHLRRHITIRHRGDGRMLPNGMHCATDLSSPPSSPSCRNPLTEVSTEQTHSPLPCSPGAICRRGDGKRESPLRSQGKAEAAEETGTDAGHLPHEACWGDNKPTHETESEATRKSLYESEEPRENHVDTRALPAANGSCLTDAARESVARPFACDKCGKSFTLKQHLRRHEKSHVGRHTCEQCGAVFAKKHQMRWHVLEHVMTESARRKGEKAEAMKGVAEQRGSADAVENGQKEESLSPTTSEKLIHPKADELLQTAGFPCPHKDCDMVFLTRGQLYRHLRRVRESTIAPQQVERTIQFENDDLRLRSCDYTCEKCSETFVRFSSLVAHRRDAHPTNVHVCETCNKRYSRLSRLREHIRVGHLQNTRCFFPHEPVTPGGDRAKKKPTNTSLLE
ncbi:hypothetical protein NCLIV_055350 [Neospora caninum Liverpool]|uniref:C2H2-type domain-containing protein n=1 Tax=Neospora caninum (strain Liverpool) TaxID=572307 RepID=F0VN14_NEOCL|nr:hypothetical protein NCLIV_055350 [Neospora caninum Liverpool]CBZ55110.1 hypothetical protein NCLIV_055350 [Neospora caninum Liverpool]|eukprot:XP_003885138.1 hypothetical protein NCLIV_055350 [Neospora caninum Liverpool]